MAIQKTASGDLTTSIAKRIYEAAIIGDAHREEAKDIIGKEVDDPMLRRGEFFGHALGAMATQWLPERFQHQMPDLRGTEYLMRGQRRSLMTPFASPIDPKPTSAQAMARAGGRPFPFIAAETGFRPDGNNPSSMTPKFSQKNDMFGLRSLGKGIKVREEKLGKFLAAVALSITKSLASISKKVDETEEGVIVAKDGIAGTHKQLEDNSNMLESKLDAIIDALRIQNDNERKGEDRLEAYMKESQLELEADRSDAKKIRMVDDDDAEYRMKQEIDAAERQEDINDNETQLNLPVVAGDDGKGFARGGVIKASGPDSGYLALLHGDEMITPLDNNYTQGQTMATNSIMSAETGFMPGNNPKSMTPKFTPAPSVSPLPSPSANTGGTDLLSQAIELPAKAAGIVTMGIIGDVLSKGKVPGSAIPQIKNVVAPIAAAFGISDLVSQNIARDSAISGSEAGRRAAGSSPDASGENKKRNFLQRMWGWVTGAGGSGGGTSIRNYRGGGYSIGNVGESAQGGGSSISNSNYGGSTANSIAFFGGGNPVDKMKFDPKQPDRPNPHPPGTLLYNIWQRRMQEYQMMKEAGMVSSSEFFTKVASSTQNNEISPPGSVGAVYNLVNNESMEGEIRDLVTEVAHDPDVVLNNASQGTTDNQVEYSPLAAKGSPFPAGFNISPYA